MHEKLSEAVKLYDRLLTEQVSHPPWRASASARPVAAAGYAHQYQPSPAAPTGQWSTVQQQVTSPMTQPAQTSYFNPQQAVPDRQPPNGVYATSSSTEPYTQVYGTSQLPISLPAQSPRAEYAQFSQNQPYAVTSPPPMSVHQYQTAPPPPETYLSNAPTPASVQSPLPQPQQVPPYQPPAVQSPPLAPQHSPIPPPSQSPLTRHNTVSYTPAPPAINSQVTYLSRSKTMSHTTQQLQQLQQAVVPPPMPNFPVAPTAPPEGYQTYSSPTPQPEPQREALLIDL